MPSWLTTYRRKKRRRDTQKRLEKMGFTVVDASGVLDGHVAERRILITAPNGEPVPCKVGLGFPTIFEAYKAAREWEREQQEKKSA